MFRYFLMAFFLCFGQFVHAQTLLDVDFNQHTDGNYNFNRIAGDFQGTTSVRGVTAAPPLNRVSIIGGGVAFDGQSLAVNCRDRGIADSGAHWFADLNDDATEAYLSYRVRFSDGFDFSGGIKLPGLVGGTAPEGTIQANGTNGWMTRMMLRPGTNSFGRLISIAKYHQSGFASSGGEDYRSCRGADDELTTIEPRKWYRVLQRVKLNSLGQADGVLQVWLDGELVLDQQDIVYRNIASLEIDRFNFSCFVDGAFAGPFREQFAYFDDIKVTTSRNLFVPDDYDFIGSAVNNSNPGDRIYVRAGTHGVGASGVIITHPLEIIGETGASTDVRGTGGPDAVDPPVFDVRSANVKLQLLNISSGNAGIKVNENMVDVEVRNTNISLTDFGLYVEPNCHRLRVVACDFTSNTIRGVDIEGCDDILVSWSGAFSNGFDGFCLSNCDRASILRNTARLNGARRSGTTYAFDISDSDEVLFRANNIEDQEHSGVHFSGCDDCIMFSNTILNSGRRDLIFRLRLFGSNLVISDCDSMFIIDNRVTSSAQTSVRMSNMTNSIIRENFFFGTFGLNFESSEFAAVSVSGSTGNRFVANSIDTNGVDGIGFFFSVDNTVTRNVFSGFGSFHHLNGFDFPGGEFDRRVLFVFDFDGLSQPLVFNNTER